MASHAEARSRRRMCTSKDRYRDIHQASRAAHNLGRKRGRPLRVYECDECKGFHLTSVVVRDVMPMNVF